MFNDRINMAFGLLRAADPVSVLAAGIVMHFLYLGDEPINPSYWTVMVLGVMVAVNMFSAGGLYRIDPSGSVDLRPMRATLLWLGVVSVMVVGLFLTKIADDFSRGWMILWAVGTTVSLLVTRIGVSLALNWYRRTGKMGTRVAVIGSGPRTRSVIERLYHGSDQRLIVVGGYVLDDAAMEFQDEVPLFGTAQGLRRQLARGLVDEVILAFDGTDEAAFEATLKQVSEHPVTLHATTGTNLDKVPVLGLARYGDVLLLRLADRPLTGWSAIMKALEDKVLSALLILLLAVPLALIALAVKLTSSGPILFKQRRFGFNNNEIQVYKFRTMWQDTAQDGPKVDQATRNDPRVTPIGAFLRRTSLDELPQLFNVLQGTMSLVGPRPHAVAHNEHYGAVIDGYLTRHRVKPGITGWAQVNGLRGEITSVDQMKRRLEHDLHYIENWSIMLDLRILLMTPFHVLSQRNAY